MGASKNEVGKARYVCAHITSRKMQINLQDEEPVDERGSCMVHRMHGHCPVWFWLREWRESQGRISDAKPDYRKECGKKKAKEDLVKDRRREGGKELGIVRNSWEKHVRFEG